MENKEAEALLADKAYDAEERVSDVLAKKQLLAVIPSKSNRKNKKPYDRELYKARHLIENFFALIEAIQSNSNSLRSNSWQFFRGDLSGRFGYLA